MKKIWILLLIPLVANSDTTGNLLNQNFDSNAWSGTATGRHGSYEIAANHGQYLESTISLSNTLTEDQIKYGWTSTLGADIWHWNNATSETEMIQVITGSDGSVVTQSRKVTISGCGYTNCGSHQTYTDSHVEGMNSNTDYEIKVRFNFSESTQSPYHWAVDLENPTLYVEYETNPVFLSNTQTAQITTAVEDVEEVKIEEFKFEEVKIDEIKIEDIYIASINSSIELEYKPELEEEIVLDIVPVMEVNNDDTKNIEEVSTEIKEYKEESFDDQTGNEIEQEVQEETNFVRDDERESGTESYQSSDSGREQDTTISRDNSQESFEDDAETTVSQRNPEENISNGNSDRSSQEDISIEIADIESQVANRFESIDKQLVATQQIVARSMQSRNQYDSSNLEIFNQPNIDGGNIDDYIRRTYIDDRELYASSQTAYNDRVAEYQTKIDTAQDNVIRAENELKRIINGY